MKLPSSCSLHDARRQPNAPNLPITSSRLDGVTPLRPSSSCSLEPPSTARLLPGTAYPAGLASKSQRVDRYTHGVISPVWLLKAFEPRITDPPKTAVAHHPAAPARIALPQTNARHDPKTGRRGNDLANRLDQTSYFAWVLSLQPSGSRGQQAVSRSCCRIRRTEVKPVICFSSSSPPRSSRTEEVAYWRWSPLLWRFYQWEVSHRRLLLCASPRMGGTTWARHRRSRPQRHPCKQGREVRPSRRNWSRSSGRDQPGKQKSYPHASLGLL